MSKESSTEVTFKGVVPLMNNRSIVRGGISQFRRQDHAPCVCTTAREPVCLGQRGGKSRTEGNEEPDDKGHPEAVGL